MAFRFVTVLMLATALASCSSAPPRASRGSSSYMQAQGSYASGNVPDMEEKRKINEQECTKAIDLIAGNLRCK